LSIAPGGVHGVGVDVGGDSTGDAMRLCTCPLGGIARGKRLPERRIYKALQEIAFATLRSVCLRLRDKYSSLLTKKQNISPWRGQAWDMQKNDDMYGSHCSQIKQMLHGDREAAG